MSGLEILLAVAGVGVTVLVVLAMVLIVPGNTVEEGSEGAHRDGAVPPPPAPWRSPTTLT
jgi:hypothetical protein